MAKTLRPIRPNAGVRVMYGKDITRLLKAMSKDLEDIIFRTYSKQERKFLPQVAQDAAPVPALTSEISKAMKRWMRRWDIAAQRIAENFVKSIDKHSLKALESELKRAGFTVKLDKSFRSNTMIQALIKANVALIKSIPEQYQTDLYGIVMRGITDGVGAQDIKKEIHERYVKSEKRALFIARDQTNKATETIKRERDMELGITRAIWIHVPGLKTSRASHKKMNGKEFILAEGCYDEAEKRKVHTGELPGCQCTYKVIVDEFGDDWDKK